MTASDARLRPPNGLAFSRRERAASDVFKMATISREAVGWNAGLGRGSVDAGKSEYQG